MHSTILSTLGLDRPLIFFDTETTGLNMLHDRIIQLGYIKYIPGVKEAEKATLFFNPEMPIPASVTAVHGITDADVANAPLFKDEGKKLIEIFFNCYFSGFNISGFDLPLLRQEFIRAGVTFSFQSSDIIDSKTIFHAFEQRNLTAAYQFYCGKELIEAHDAMVDTEAAAEVLFAQIERYGAKEIMEVQTKYSQDFVDADGKFYWKDEQVHFNFSKHKHRSLAEVMEKEPTFLDWMLAQDFSEDVRRIVKDALKGKFPAR